MSDYIPLAQYYLMYVYEPLRMVMAKDFDLYIRPDGYRSPYEPLPTPDFTGSYVHIIDSGWFGDISLAHL